MIISHDTQPGASSPAPSVLRVRRGDLQLWARHERWTNHLDRMVGRPRWRSRAKEQYWRKCCDDVEFQEDRNSGDGRDVLEDAVEPVRATDLGTEESIQHSPSICSLINPAMPRPEAPAAPGRTEEIDLCRPETQGTSGEWSRVSGVRFRLLISEDFLASIPFRLRLSSSFWIALTRTTPTASKHNQLDRVHVANPQKSNQLPPNTIDRVSDVELLGADKLILYLFFISRSFHFKRMRSEGWQDQREVRSRGRKLCCAPEVSSGICARFSTCWIDHGPGLYCTRRGGISGL